MAVLCAPFFHFIPNEFQVYDHVSITPRHALDRNTPQLFIHIGLCVPFYDDSFERPTQNKTSNYWITTKRNKSNRSA